jgi:hypothetical protein
MDGQPKEKRYSLSKPLTSIRNLLTINKTHNQGSASDSNFKPTVEIKSANDHQPVDGNGDHNKDLNSSSKEEITILESTNTSDIYPANQSKNPEISNEYFLNQKTAPKKTETPDTDNLDQKSEPKKTETSDTNTSDQKPETKKTETTHYGYRLLQITGSLAVGAAAFYAASLYLASILVATLVAILAASISVIVSNSFFKTATASVGADKGLASSLGTNKAA